LFIDTNADVKRAKAEHGDICRPEIDDCVGFFRLCGGRFLCRQIMCIPPSKLLPGARADALIDVRHSQIAGMRLSSPVGVLLRNDTQAASADMGSPNGQNIPRHFPSNSIPAHAISRR